MKNFHKVGALVCATVLATSAMAAGIVGTWKGTVHMQMPPMPANATAQQKQQMAMGMKMLAQMKVTINFKANKTYHLTASGGPVAKEEVEDGAWSMSGKTITVKPFKPKSPQEKEQKLVMSANGKTLTMNSPAGGPKITVIFTR